MEQITIEDFKKIEIKVGEIKKAEAIPVSEKLLKLTVDFGPKSPAILIAGDGPDLPASSEDEGEERDIRQVLSGIAKYVTPQSLIGVKCPFITNLPAREMVGLKSEAMIMAVSTNEGQFSLLKPDQSIPNGTKVK